MGDLTEKLEPLGAQLLLPGEKLLGSCVATRSSTFSGTMAAIFVTPDRLVIQDLSRKFEPKGELIRLTPGEIAEAKAGPGGGGWWEVSAAILDSVSTELKLKTNDGQKLKLLMMNADGPLFGKLGGGAVQQQGVRALGEWFARHADSGLT
jgi:hypothetical protein